MSRKLLSLVVALAVVLSSMSFAFAAATSTSIVDGVADANVKAAVGKLFALGMTDGMEDGKFHPEGKLTRAQATTFIVRALGLESAANAAKGATSFTDVAADNWASGYINVAAGQGLVQGMGDGTFAPDSEVTYAQAITMLVRALGYQDSFLKGTWPGNYLAKAADVKVTKNVTITPNGVADRGAVALLLGNTLDARVVKITKYTDTGIEYGEVKNSDDKYVTLVEDKLDLRKYDEQRIVKDYRLGGLKTDEISLIATKTGDSNLGLKKIAAGLNYDGVMGAKVNVYVDDSGRGKVVYAEQAVSTEVIFDSIDKLMDTDEDKDTPELKTKFGGKTLMFADGAYLYSNAGVSGNTENVLTISNNDTDEFAGLYGGAFYGKYVVEGNKIVFAELYGSTWDYTALLVKSVSGDTITYWDNSGNEKTLNIAANYAGGAVVKINGTKSTLADLKAYDVVYIKNATYDSKITANLFAIRQSVTGKVGGVKGAPADTGSIDIAGTTYDVTAYTTYSTDKDENIQDLDTATPAVSNYSATIDDMYDATAVVALDISKKIRHISTEVNVSSSEKYGIIKRVNTDSTDSMKVFTQDGEDVTYSFEDTDEIGWTDSRSGGRIASMTNLFDAYTTNKYWYASFKLNKDGKIAKNTLLLKKNSAAELVSGDFGADTYTAGSNSYFVDTKKVTVIDATGNIDNRNDDSISFANDPDTSSWDSLAGKEDVSGMYVISFKKNEVSGNAASNDVTGLFVVEGNAVTDPEAAYVVAYFTKDGDKYAKIQRYGQTAPETVKLSNQSVDQSVYFAESARLIEKTSGDKVEIKTSWDADFRIVGGKVSNINGDKYTITAGTVSSVYKVDSTTVVYSGDGLKSVSNIQEGDMVVAIAKNGLIQVIEWNQSDVSTTRAVEATITVSSGAVTVTSATATAGGWNTWDASMFFNAVTGQYVKNSGTASNLADGTYNALIWKRLDENKIRSVVIKP